MAAEPVGDQHAVGLVGRERAGDPDLVAAHVGDQDVIARHRAAQVAQHPLGLERERVVVDTLLELCEDVPPQLPIGRGVLLALHEVVEQLERLAHVGHHLDRGLVVAVDLGGNEVDVDDRLLALRVPELRRVLDQVVAHRDDEVGPLEPARDVVA